jgi:hypothetical protein
MSHRGASYQTRTRLSCQPVITAFATLVSFVPIVSPSMISKAGFPSTSSCILDFIRELSPDVCCCCSSAVLPMTESMVILDYRGRRYHGGGFQTRIEGKCHQAQECRHSKQREQPVHLEGGCQRPRLRAILAAENTPEIKIRIEKLPEGARRVFTQWFPVLMV